MQMLANECMQEGAIRQAPRSLVAEERIIS